MEMTNRLRALLKTPEEEWYEGKVTHHDHFDVLDHIDDALNRVPAELAVEDRHWFMTSYFGHFLTMHRPVKFSGGVIHQLLLREVHHNGPSDEMRFMLGTNEVRFSKVEFYLITGLRFRVVPDTSHYVNVDNDLHHRYFGGKDEISSLELRDVLRLIEFQQAYDCVKLCLIYMLNWILMGLDERLKIPVWQIRLVDDLDAFDMFPWGAHVYSHSIYSFKHALDGRRERFQRRQQAKRADKHMQETYNIYGLSYVLLVRVL
ncbi:hypothetical protein Ddye_021110 [Dipteronia dyeriana]|uniref:DUF1985 domain-containing protein n=1 Tax=Dipteronia dyeriana TaxID=168575 RepID=A0AAD9WXN8_9ROSI|nr:hypothetical protein Ddye_021110 [Dipteronia dyeriana]